MSQKIDKKRTWNETFQAWTHPRVLTMLFLGFSAGVPILLIFSTLSVWLREAGVSKSAVTFFSWAALGYSFKFIWAPIVDKMPLPGLTALLGRRRSWLILSQFLVIAAIIWMSSINPAASEQSLTIMALAAVMLGFSSATQDIVIDAYRIECVGKDMQALLSSSYIAGYRIGMIVAGAGSLYLAALFGTTRELYSFGAWRFAYMAMALVMLVGVITTLVSPEPELQDGSGDAEEYTVLYYVRFLSLFIIGATTFALIFFYSGQMVVELKGRLVELLGVNKKTAGFFVEALRLSMAIFLALLAAKTAVRAGVADRAMVQKTYVDPVKDFFSRYGLKPALLLLCLVGFYRLSDIVLGVMANVFYIDMGFTKEAIAGITKTFGPWMTILGGFLGGTLALRYGVYRVLFLGGFLSSATNLLFMLLARNGAPDLSMLTVVIIFDNLSAGIATTAFVAFLSGLTNISFTAVQYAIFSSLMTLFPKLIGGYSGTMVSAWGYQYFFLLTAIMGIPVLILIRMVQAILEVDRDKL